MFSTFSYTDNSIVIAGKIWSDFWANIPLIRSFSFGDNIPPEYPLFPGERIRYHFFFFFLVGMLEKMGLRIDFALNFLSIIGFSGMMIGVYFLTKQISKSKLAGWIAIFLFIFNSSFSWLYYLDKGIDSLPEVVTNTEYGSHGPYDNTIVSGFWKLNVYTNQRHLTLAFTFFFVAIWSIVYAKNKKWAYLGVILLISLSWMHKAILLISFLLLGALFITQTGKRRRILGALLLAGSLCIPGILYLNGDGVTTEKAITWRPGFLFNATDWHEFSFYLKGIPKWLVYWFLNLGFLPIVALFGWITLSFQALKGKKVWKKITTFFTSDMVVWFVVSIVIFGIANLFSFASDLGTNHKFINFTQIVLTAFSASFLAILWRTRVKVMVPVLLILLSLGGIFDFFPVFNDNKIIWDDVEKDPVARWIYYETKPDSIFLNTSYGYNSIGIAGRKIFWGWDYFTNGIGYNLRGRHEELKPLFQGVLTQQQACEYLISKSIDYIYLDLHDQELKNTFLDVRVNQDYFDTTFVTVATFPLVKMYDVELTCQN